MFVGVHTDRNLPNISQTVTLPDGSEQQVFNPGQPFAFAPPQYDTLPKEPPKYADAMNVAQTPATAHTNGGFEQSQPYISTPTNESPEPIATIEHSELPPIYSEASSTQTTQINDVTAQSSSVQ